MNPYTVVIDPRDWAKLRRSTRPNIVREVERIRDTYLAVHPLDRTAAAGKMKRLKGRDAGKYQYDLPDGYRLWYTVDEGRMTVDVVYIGPHP